MAFPWNHVIGITGGIGSGKSAVLEILARHGFFCLSADRLTHELLAPGGLAVDQICSLFGSEVLNQEGGIDRRLLGTLVFRNQDRKKALEEVLHPLVLSQSETAFTTALANGEDLLAYESPLIFEARLDQRGFRQIALVICSLETRIDRVMARSGLPREAILLRIQNQMPDEEKVKKADIVINNDGNLEDLEHEVLQKLLRVPPE
ncbi:MAG: dephospho-CoA kinase [Fimbriimonadaceae bacterium]|jgi:dephospho-CoA kinase|nr:dephospho-CoA kinase [Fimbriimonadaceae bacterium]